MALGSCQIRSPCRLLALCFAGLLLVSASRPCEARRWLSESEKHHLKWDRIVTILIVLLVVAFVLTLLLAFHFPSRCCRRRSPVRVRQAPEEGRNMEFSRKFFSPFVVVKVQQVLEEDDPKSIPPTMVRSPYDSPEPRHWTQQHVSSLPPVRHHHLSLPSEPISSGGQQNPPPAADLCLRDIAPAPLDEFSYSRLAKATRGFKNGEEFGSGVLYAGGLLFDDGLVQKVAIKRFHKNIIDVGQIRQDLRRKKFMLKHRNLVTLFGYCLHDGKLYFVYDWMRYHSLDNELFAEKGSSQGSLTLAQRHSIIKDVARGLLELHDRNAFHGAVKASNIMLETSSTGFRARLTDFRYSALLAELPEQHETGTLGSLLYRDTTPTAAGPSLASDVLHFGIVMLEVLCGRRMFAHDQLPAGYSSLLDWVRTLDDNDGRLDEALDDDTKNAPDFNQAQADVLLRLSLNCSNPDPSQRPTARTILLELSKEVPTEIQQKQVRSTASYQPTTSY